ncbi:MAG: hypothetical protein HYY03_06975 [Chloroflexi bacterium]|nr:hypothetical protein [Chloroflexota bacterium]
MLRQTYLPALIALSVLAAGCGTGAPVMNPATPGPAEETAAARASDQDGGQGGYQEAVVQDGGETSVVIIGESLWPLNRGDSLRSLMQGDAIVLGSVVGIALPYDPRPGYLGWTPRPCPFPPDHPKFVVCSWTPSPEELLRPPGRDFTVYEVAVERVLGTSGPKPGDKILVRDGGGVWEGKLYHLSGDPPLVVGATYLLSLDRAVLPDFPNSTAYLTDVPFSQFTVDPDGRLQPVDGMWASMPAVAALSGLTVEQALAGVEAVLAAKP